MSRNYLQSPAFQQQVEADAERDDRLAAIRAARQQHAPMTITGATMHLTETLTDMTADPPPLEPKFCKDCKHCVAGEHGYTFARCAMSSVPAFLHRDYLVTGELLAPEMRYCSTFRMFDDRKHCGPRGRLFEPKESTCGCT